MEIVLSGATGVEVGPRGKEYIELTQGGQTVRIVVGGRDANEKLEHLAPLLSAVKALNDELETALAE
jgi:hypothetical protein